MTEDAGTGSTHIDTSVEGRLLPICTACAREGEASIGRVIMAGWEADGMPERLNPAPVTSRVWPARECCQREAMLAAGGLEAS